LEIQSVEKPLKGDVIANSHSIVGFHHSTIYSIERSDYKYIKLFVVVLL